MNAAAEGQAVRTADRPSGPLATAGRLWAVARLTLLEAVRRKVFVLLLLFGAAIVSSAAFFPAIDTQSRLRLIEVWSVRASLLFSVIVAIFLAGFSLPGDFETRRVYTLVTKPLHKMTLFGGKFLGFFLLLAIFLGSMAAVSVAYIHVVSLLSKDFPALKAEPRFIADGMSGVNSRQMKDSERTAALPGGALIWRFTGLSRGDFEGKMRIALTVNLNRFRQQFAIEGNVRVEAVNPRTMASQALTEQLIHTNQETAFEFDSALIGDDGSLEFRAGPAEGDLIIDAEPGSVVLFGKSRNFDLNFFRGMLLVLFQSTVVMAVTLAGSTFLNAPVSIVLGITLYIVGSMWGFIHDSLRDFDVQMEQFRQQLSQGQVRQARTPDDLPLWLVNSSTFVSRVALKVIPDFSQFNFSDYLLNDYAVMGRDLAGGFLTMLTRVVVLLAVGLFAMVRRDFST